MSGMLSSSGFFSGLGEQTPTHHTGKAALVNIVLQGFERSLKTGRDFQNCAV